MYRNLLVTIFVLFSSLTLSAQSWEAGVFAGASGYMGDINPRDFYRVNDFAFGAQVKKNFDGYWSAKLNVMQGNIWSSDQQSGNAYQQSRNLRFYSPITEASLQVEFNFFDYTAGVSRAIWTPYLFTGIGGVSFNPKVNYAGKAYELKNYKTEGQTEPYQTLALSIPYGIGVKYNIKGNWSLVGELGYRTAYTDYLDDVSGNYPTDLASRPTPDKLFSDPSGLAVAGTQRGDGRKRDTYMFAGISLTFTFVGRNCPVVR